MKKLFIAFTVLFSFTTLSAQVVSDTDKKILDKIKQGNASYNTIESNFKQVKHVSILGDNVVSAGVLYYNKPEQMAMKYYDPAGDLMLINGDDCVMVSSGRQQRVSAKSNSKMRGMKTILSACVMGDLDKVQAEKITCFESDNYYIVSAEINRKLNKSNISKVMLNYDKKDHSITMLQTFEPDGSYVIYELTNKKLNKPVDSSVFNIPAK